MVFTSACIQCRSNNISFFSYPEGIHRLSRRVLLKKKRDSLLLFFLISNGTGIWQKHVTTNLNFISLPGFNSTSPLSKIRYFEELFSIFIKNTLVEHLWRFVNVLFYFSNVKFYQGPMTLLIHAVTHDPRGCFVPVICLGHFSESVSDSHSRKWPKNWPRGFYVSVGEGGEDKKNKNLNFTHKTRNGGGLKILDFQTKKTLFFKLFCFVELWF